MSRAATLNGPAHAAAAAAGLAPPLQQFGRTHVRVGRRTLSYFAGCDYFRLASHPEVIAAIHAGLDRFGLNVAASRRTTGNHALYETLENALARFSQAGSATLLSNGYMTNLAAAQALAGDVTHALIDERAHGSLFDAAALLDCPVLPFRHRDPAHARRVAAQCQRKPRARIILLTDGLFAHSGEVAPLDEYLAVLPGRSVLMVDDAHGVGVLGRHGRGTPEYLGLRAEPGRLIQTITLSKAFGVYGGAIVGSADLRRRILERSHLFVGNTPLPLPLAQGALKAIEIVRTTPRLRRRLVFNTAYVKAALRESGFAVNDGPGPVVPVHPRSGAAARRLSRALLRANIHPPLIQYPGGPGPAYFRFAISSEHDAAQLDALTQALGSCGRS